jgi:hypothetical protein
MLRGNIIMRLRMLLLAGLAVLACALGKAAEAAPAKAVLDGGRCSGLPWASGAAAGADDLGSWRGRPLDVRSTFTAHDNWENIIASAKWMRSHLGTCAAVVEGVAMLPESHRGQHAACAAGAFDEKIRAFGVNLVANGAAAALLRIGYEFNGGNFPWAVVGDQSLVWKRCYRRWVNVLRSVPGQAFTFIWNPNGRGRFSTDHNIEYLYPGDSYVDIIGIDYYDRCPAIKVQAEWDSRVNKWMKSGSPDGIGAWLAYAKSKGKKLAVPEWGIGGPQGCSGAGYDNALYVSNMARFLRANAASIAYEAYFNGGSAGDRNGYRLAPTSVHPLAAAAYLTGWGPAAPAR